MSKFLNTELQRKNLRWRLLASASAIALVASLCGEGAALAQDAHYPLWIEFGAHLDEISGGQDAFLPTVTSALVQDGFTPWSKIEKMPRYAFGGEAGISFEPDGSSWKFAASVNLGRSNSSRSPHEQDPGGDVPCHLLSIQLTCHIAHRNSSGGQNTQDENHMIVDFKAGHDIGLGLSGSDSTMNLGVRFAQFSSKSETSINAVADFYFASNLKYAEHHHLYEIAAINNRSFRGAGPQVSWDGSAPILGNDNDGVLAADLGLNGAVLFGRQKASGHHRTDVHYYKTSIFLTGFHSAHTYQSIPHDRSRSVMVPNVGAELGLSYRIQNFKVALGYRGDFFFGAIDGGIDKRKTETRGFYGPFAKVSIGIGD